MLLNRKKQKAVLFADISGSSALYKTKGNSHAKSIIDHLISEIKKLSVKHKGRVVKTIGDEVMVCFSSGDSCIETAVSIQKSFASSFSQHHLQVSIGISFGEVLEEKGDLFAETVNDAAYLTKMAKGSQILFSEGLLSELSSKQKSKAREFDRVTFKGATEPSAVFRMYWQGESDTHNETRFLSTDVVLEHVTNQILTLKKGEQEITIEPKMTPFMIGRNVSSCQLTIDGTQISREHCHIGYNRGKFVIIDHSTNGCYLKPKNGLEFYLRREEFPLLEDSDLSLGVPTHKAGDNLIEILYG